MRRLLNTLYVTTEGAWLSKDGENLVVEVDRIERARLPAHMLDGLVCFGRVMVSPPLLGYCAEHGITVTYLTTNGRFLARVEGPVSGNVLLRREQYRRSDNRVACGAIVKNQLLGKIHNQRVVVSRALRDYRDSFDPQVADALGKARKRLSRILDRIVVEDDQDVMRGFEGEAAQVYYAVIGKLIRVDNGKLQFTGRSRRPPMDPVNALLSFIYTLLTHDCRAALETVGLDPSVGFLHRDRPGRPSLALDLIEEFRPLLADRLALSLVNRRQLGERDFTYLENGAVLIKDEARKVVLQAYQERKREEIEHLFIGEKVQIGMLPIIQSQLLARHLRGDLDAYPPYLWK